MRLLYFPFLLLAVGGRLLAEGSGEPEPFTAELVTKLDPAAHKEASGVAPSRRRDDLLWLINDSGNRPQLHAVTTEGKSLGFVTLQGGWNFDWEDLASFELDGKAYLAIGDIGDNQARRRSSTIYVVEEPVLSAERFSKRAKVSVAWKLRFSYPPGPRDAEAMAVDATEGAIYLLSKFELPKKLYRLPLQPPAQGEKKAPILLAERLGPVTIPVPEKKLSSWQDWHGALRSLLVTSMAFDPVHEQAVLLTYSQVFHYRRQKGQSWLATLAQQTTPIALEPKGKQYEGICFSRDGQTLFVVSEREKRGSPGVLVRVRLPPALIKKENPAP